MIITKRVVKKRVYEILAGTSIDNAEVVSWVLGGSIFERGLRLWCVRYAIYNGGDYEGLLRYIKE